MNKNLARRCSFPVILFIMSTLVFAGDDDPVAWWKLEKTDSRTILETIKQTPDTVHGFHKHVKGISGDALLFDGYTTYVRKSESGAPMLADGFTLEAWIAFQAYPWNWVAIVDQKTDSTAGYYLGVNAHGIVRLQVVVDGNLKTLDSDIKIDLLKWAHIAGSFDPQKGMRVYINGKEAGRFSTKGKLSIAEDTDILIGRSHEKLPPAHPIRLDLPASYSFDGIIDEVKIYDKALKSSRISRDYKSLKPKNEMALSFRKLPAGPDGPGRFGAYYTKLKFSETWDAPWRVGPYADVVVRFDEASYKFVFWRGTSYIPFWVTESGAWYTNEFNETWGDDVLGCAEPMSDKQTRHSHVRILESNDARVIVHWRYALVDNRYVIAKTDSISGWGDWTDEYFIIYPDGIGIRKIHLWTSEPTKPHQFQEAIILNPPGTYPEDNIDVNAITMVNMKGETHTYSWADGPPEKIDQPENFNIQFVNLKSKSKPFLIVNEGKPTITRRDIDPDGPWLKPYRGEVNREISIFPWWNHWPVAQIPSDGRWATEPDRVSHSSLSNDFEWQELELTDRTHVRVHLHGLTAIAPKDIVPLAKSWLYPADLVLHGEGFISESYLNEERAYVLARNNESQANQVRFKLKASPDHPVINPAFVIRNWGNGQASLSIDGKMIPRSKTFRYGYRHTLEGSDLIVWLKLNTEESIEISLSVMD